MISFKLLDMEEDKQFEPQITDNEREMDSILKGLKYHIEIDKNGFGIRVIDNMTYEEFVEYLESQGCINIKDVKW